MARAGLAVLLVALALAAGCGLPDSFYLTPPSVTVQNDPTLGQFTLASTTANSEPEFRGFEVYYKLYASPPPSSDTNLGGSTGTVDALSQNGFLTLCQFGDPAPDSRATVPLIPIAPSDRGASFSITVNVGDFFTDADAYYTYTAPSGTKSSLLERHVRQLSGVGCKPFTVNAGNYDPVDLDVANMYQDALTAGGVMWVAMYAASYGLQDLSTPIYSYPVYMGYLSISRFP